MREHLVLALLLLLVLAAPAAAQDSTATKEDIPFDSAMQILEYKERIEKDPYDGDAYTRLGILYTQEGMYEEARSAFISAIQIAPQEPLTHLNLAVCLIKMENWEEAVPSLQAFQSLSPTDGRGYVLMGDVKMHLGQVEEAREQWRQGLRLPGVSADDKAEMLRRLVSSHEEEDDLAGALAELEDFQDLLGQSAFDELRARRLALTMKLAKRAETAGDVDKALDLLARARKLEGAPATAWTAATELLLDEGRLDEAEALATENLEAPKGTHDFIRGRVAETRGDLRAAARWFRSAVEADPTYPGANAALGNTLAQLGETREAQKALDRAADLGEGGTASLYNLAVVKARDGDFRGAVPLLQRVLDDEPERKDAWRLLAAGFRKLKEYSRAAETSQEIIDRFGPDAGDLYQLAYAQAKIDDHKDAAANYQIVTALEPDNFNAFYGLGRSLLQVGRLDEAVQAFERAVELQPENEIAVFNLAFALQKAGRYEDAIDTYLEASDLKETARSYTNIAICYQNLGDKDTADEYYRKANEMKKRG